MASTKSYKPIFSGLQFEFDESEVWDSGTTPTNNEVAASETRRSTVPNPRHAKKAAMRKGGSGVVKAAAAAAASLPVNIPDWKRILGGEYQDRRPRQDSDDNAAAAAEEEEEDGGLPPHEYLARTRVASLSVHEGVGRTLKGRDLWRVRNAIWKQIGFED